MAAANRTTSPGAPAGLKKETYATPRSQGRDHPLLAPSDEFEAMVFVSQDGNVCIEQMPLFGDSPDLIELSPAFAIRMAAELLRLSTGNEVAA